MKCIDLTDSHIAYAMSKMLPPELYLPIGLLQPEIEKHSQFCFLIGTIVRAGMQTFVTRTELEMFNDNKPTPDGGHEFSLAPLLWNHLAYVAIRVPIFSMPGVCEIAKDCELQLVPDAVVVRADFEKHVGFTTVRTSKLEEFGKLYKVLDVLPAHGSNVRIIESAIVKDMSATELVDKLSKERSFCAQIAKAHGEQLDN